MNCHSCWVWLTQSHQHPAPKLLRLFILCPQISEWFQKAPQALTLIFIQTVARSFQRRFSRLLLKLTFRNFLQIVPDSVPEPMRSFSVLLLQYLQRLCSCVCWDVWLEGMCWSLIVSLLRVSDAAGSGRIECREWGSVIQSQLWCRLCVFVQPWTDDCGH